MSGTHLFYNGILLRDCETQEFVQDVEYDESRTDILFSRIRITVASQVVSLPPPPPPPDPEDEDAPQPPPREHPSTARIEFGLEPEAVYQAEDSIDRISIIRSRLQEPRKDFWFALNGVGDTNPSSPPLFRGKDGDPNAVANSYRVLLAATGEYAKKPEDDESTAYPKFLRDFGYNGSAPKFTRIIRVDHIDVDEGPKPKNVSVKIIGGNFFRVLFTIEVCLPLCRGDLTKTTPPVRDARRVKGVISNRWSVTESLDSDFRTSHIIEGTLIVANHRYKAQAMRTMIQPALFPYAKLEARSFAVDRSGLKMNYQFTIREAGVAPPPGVIDWDGTYTESSGAGLGQTFGTINLTVKGAIKRPPNMTAQQQKTMLLRVLYSLLQSRITGINAQWAAMPGQNPTTVVVKDALVTEHMKLPSMELRARVMYSSNDMNDFNLRLENMGAPIPIPGYNPKWWPMPDFWQWDEESENAEEDTDLGGGSYFEGYNQGPCDLWHAMPRYAKTDEIVLAEPYNPGEDPETTPPPSTGFGGHDTNPDGSLAQGKATPGWFSKPFEAYEVPSIKGELGFVDTLPVVAVDRFGVDPTQQLQGYPYITWDSDIRYSTKTGRIHLPLSRVRDDPQARAIMENAEYSEEEPTLPALKQTAVVVSLHAPLPQRVFKLKVQRQGAYPELPLPRDSYRDSNGYMEYLLDYKIINDTPYLDQDNVTMIYGMHCEYVYGLTRNPGSDALNRSVKPTSSALNTFANDKLRAASSKIDRTTPVQNKVSILNLFDFSNTIEDGGGYVPPEPA